MKKLFLLIILTGTVLCGCGTEKEDAVIEEVRKLEVPVSDTEYISLTIEDIPIVETDNHTFWELEDGTVISVSTDIASDKNSADNPFTWLYNRTFENNLYMHVPDNKLWFYTSNLDALALGRDLTLNNDVEIYELPDYVQKEMVLLSNNLYLPEGTEDNNVLGVTCSLYTAGTGWLKSYIYDGDFHDVSTSLVNIVLLNSGSGVDSWYYDGSILYITSGNNIIAAKKLQYNEWYVYYGSSEFRDYILTGVNTVRSSL